jgi:hypothetical protein
MAFCTSCTSCTPWEKKMQLPAVTHPFLRLPHLLHPFRKGSSARRWAGAGGGEIGDQPHEPIAAVRGVQRVTMRRQDEGGDSLSAPAGPGPKTLSAAWWP